MDITPEQIALTFLEGLDTCVTYIPDRPCFCDSEINGFMDPISDLESILTYDWIKTNEITKCESLPQFHSIRYSSNETQLTVISAQYDDLPDDAQFLVLTRPNDFVILGVVGSHPMIESSHFIYCNSDGSGPNILGDMNNPQKLAHNLIFYYREFINNRYH